MKLLAPQIVELPFLALDLGLLPPQDLLLNLLLRRRVVERIADDTADERASRRPYRHPSAGAPGLIANDRTEPGAHRRTGNSTHLSIAELR